MKLGSMFGKPDPPKAESPPPVVSVQPQSQSPKPADECYEPESEKPSPSSGETESADASDTVSCDTLAQSPQSGLPSHLVSLEEDLDKSQIKVTLFEVDRSVADTPDTVHADLDTEQPKDLLTKEAAKSPPDSSRFDSSGNLSPISSQLSSEPEERRDPSGPRPPLNSQPSTLDKEDEDEEEETENKLHPLPEPGCNKDWKDSPVILPKPMLDNHDIKTQTKN
ncbi:hypothetical protein D5F01_LYC09084 [Larimichthys crocea]|uniref:Uncharacterized protein n=1 Tax=Larimichthys crocea TaxID=215358 RepID=A0A6G0IJN5_LARCR|nr:hypothetical protein D5F01_LYC09084 [Larimichthys crocea]